MEAFDLALEFVVRRGLFSRRRVLRALDGVNLGIPRGKTVGVVGESGCGKTTLGRVLAGLLTPTRGEVRLQGRAISEIPKKEFRRKVQMVFQDPFSSLDPRQRVRGILGEPLRFLLGLSRSEAERRSRELLERVGLLPDHLDRYPHEFSGGQRQRIAIARAIAPNPEFVVLDEPTSALDVSVQGQLLNLLFDLQVERSLSYLFVSHDLSIVRVMSDEVAVMYLGKIVERGTTEEVFRSPKHPYTQVLLSALPSPDPDRPSRRIVPRGDVPSPLSPPPGCPFHPRCFRSREICRLEEPPLEGGRHEVSCHFPGPPTPEEIAPPPGEERRERA